MVAKKIIFCFFGVIPRSIKYTYQSIKENILDVLSKNNYKVDIYVFNLNVGYTLVDNNSMNQEDINIIPYNFYEEYLQDDLDIDIEKLNKVANLKFRTNYTKQNTQNALRQMYSEYRVGLFLEKIKNNYDISIICGPDYYLSLIHI